MKQKLLAVVLAIIALFMCSCNRKQDESSTDKITSSVLAEGEIDIGTVAGDYIYRSVDIHEKRLLIKYHIPTGTASTVCQDPFCVHEMTCPFFISSINMASIGDILYYVSKDDERCFIRSYNGNNLKIEQLYNSNGIIANLFSYNYYLYFTDVQPGKNTDYKATVYRLDTQTNDMIEIHSTSTSERIYEIKDNKIIWRSGSGYYSTNLNGNFRKDIKPEDQQWGNYTYRNEDKSEGQSLNRVKYNLYRTNISTGEETLIATDICYYYFYGDKIIYFKSFGKATLINTIDDQNYYDFFGGDVYIMNLDGSDNRLLCHADNCYIFGLSPNRNNELVCGDWIGILAKNFYETNEGITELTNTDMLLVNVVTGEYKYAAYNPFE